MRWLRSVPWLLAIAGLTGLLIQLAGQSPQWIWLVAAWVVVIGAAWLSGRVVRTTRDQRLAAGLMFLVVLVPLSWWGGFWLIPAGVAWLVVEAVDRDAGRRRTGPIA